ncbi:amidase [Aliiroseovarius sp. YM-037]|uniref:amidase n=1 Tax=Aliiroseovarius sp. YM-037 TaxID=3341728 RepID=UPI003A7FFC65
MTPLNELSATEIACHIREGRTTPSDVMTAHLDRIAAREAEVGAFQYLDADAAMARAQRADRQPPTGPLHGVPFVTKDIIDTADMPTGWGFAPYDTRQPTRNAACVEALIAAGAVPIGKTVTTEFAYFRPGKTANPHHLDHTPGGSSSGSAAAVADHMAPLGLGSQTAASLIRPAAYCGVAAFRPTLGGFPLAGVMGLSPALDTLGVLARGVADLSLATEVLSGQRLPPPPAFEDAPPRISLMRGPHWQDGSLEMRDVCVRAMTALETQGAEVGDIAHPDIFAALTEAQITVMGYETAHTRAAEFDQYPDDISPQFAALVRAGQAVDERSYQQALRTRERANTLLNALMGDVDALLVPSAPGPAPHGLAATGDPLFSRMWNLLQVPTVALPYGKTGTGLPLGIQLIARRGDDAHLLAVAERAERAFAACPF